MRSIFLTLFLSLSPALAPALVLILVRLSCATIRTHTYRHPFGEDEEEEKKSSESMHLLSFFCLMPTKHDGIESVVMFFSFFLLRRILSSALVFL